MSGPWEKYRQPQAGPWSKYQARPQVVEPRAYNPFGSGAESLPPLPGEQVRNTVPQGQPRPTYAQGVQQALGETRGMNPLDLLRGSAGAVASMARGAAAVPLGGLAGATVGFGKPEAEQQAIAERAFKQVAGQPGENTRKVLGVLGAVSQPVTKFMEDTGADMALLPLGVEAARMPRLPVPPRVPKPRTAQEALLRNAPRDAAGAARAPLQVGNAPPDLQKAILDAARSQGGAINPEAAERHLRGAQLPVPVRLTEGQALRDPLAISEELNLRGKHPQLANRFDEQNRALAKNLQTLRERIGPDVFSTNVTEHGDTLIGAYRDLDAARRADIAAKYKALETAAGGQFPIDAPTLLRNVTQELHRKLLFDDAPASVMNALDRMVNGQKTMHGRGAPTGMTFENFEHLRTNLARIMRDSGNGNERAAAGVIRDAMEELPLDPSAAGTLKPLADTARQAARERFEAMRADPAYRAVANEKVTPDDFVRRFVIGGKRDDLGTMLGNIGENPAARQTLGVSALDFLRGSASINPNYEGNFGAAGFNKALQNLDPKLRHLLSPQDIEALSNLGEVARDTTFQPRGSFVSNPNTATAIFAEAAKEKGMGMIPFVGEPTQKFINALRDKRRVGRALEPGAGVRRLKEVDEE